MRCRCDDFSTDGLLPFSCPCDSGSAVYANSRFSSILIAQYQLPLPEPATFTKTVYDMAWPQVLAWCAAVAGVLLVGLVIKSFTRSG